MDNNLTKKNKEKSTKVFNNKWILRKKVSSGSFGVVFIGQDKITQELVAIKLEKEDNEEVRSLDREVQILEQLSGLKQVPQLFWHGSENNYNIMVTTLLGRDLAHYMKIHKKFTLKTILMLFDQLLTIIENIHNKHVIHRDLKPENILLGREQESHLVYMIDYGISKIYKDSQGRHIQFKEKKPFIGTTRYASIGAHLGQELSRKDDLESLGYVMIFLSKGTLPWQNLQHVPDKDKTEVVGEMKMRIKTSELCKDLPIEFAKYLEYVKKLSFKSQPDYSYLRNIFIKLGNQNNVHYYQNDFDWSLTDQTNSSNSFSNNYFHNNSEQKKNNVKNGLLLPPGMNDGGYSSSRNNGDTRRASNTSFNSMSQNSVYIKYQPQNSMHKPNSSLHFDDQFKPLQNNSRQSNSRHSISSYQNLRKRNESLRKNSYKINYASQQYIMSPQRNPSNSRKHKNSYQESNKHQGSLNNLSLNNLDKYNQAQHGSNYLKNNKYIQEKKYHDNHIIMEQSKSNEDGNQQQSTQYCNLEMEEMKENSLDAKIKLLHNFGVKAQFIKIKKNNLTNKSQFG